MIIKIDDYVDDNNSELIEVENKVIEPEIENIENNKKVVKKSNKKKVKDLDTGNFSEKSVDD
jgi:hypothetical protein